MKASRVGFLIIAIGGCGVAVRSTAVEPSQAEARVLGCYALAAEPANPGARQSGAYSDTLRLDAALLPWPRATGDSGPPPGRHLYHIADDSASMAGGQLASYWAMHGDSLIIVSASTFFSSEIEAAITRHGFDGMAVNRPDNVRTDSAGLEFWPERYTVTGTRISCPCRLGAAT